MVNKSQLSTKLKSTSRMATKIRNKKSQGVHDLLIYCNFSIYLFIYLLLIYCNFSDSSCIYLFIFY